VRTPARDGVISFCLPKQVNDNNFGLFRIYTVKSIVFFPVVLSAYCHQRPELAAVLEFYSVQPGAAAE
jgi:hypothetical protein